MATNTTFVLYSLTTAALKPQAPILSFAWGVATLIAIQLTIRNLLNNRRSWIDVVQFLAGFSLIIQELISFFKTMYNLTAPVTPDCDYVSYTRFLSFILFQIFANVVLILRITVLVPKNFQLFVRIILGVLFATSIAITITATAMYIKPDSCARPLNIQLNGIGKMLASILYGLLLLCFIVPFKKIVKTAAAHNVQSKNLKEVSNRVLIQTSIPLLVYFFSAILRFSGLWGDYSNLGFILEDVSIFVCMSLTFSLRNNDNSSTQRGGSSGNNFSTNNYSNHQSHGRF
ncbi:hypothetical protein HK099_001998 [Clydaea vesicula]|uniref:Uncharacterized protein n=1 Tax=Clydaea vesicula TaxID=447962 RepID=A0AAD5TWA9_9FUNG|nr:hypothetical protein HK099_001998 [Clydaea vesicula]KAJ3379597.1 hypothetical protein HDU92_006596 [Lobulomyces angularis]